MAAPLRDRLQATLGSAYTLERELGGGGMSRVFLAEDAALGRWIVVKVLASELAEGISAERFAREVRLAARLQHPNVVPVHAAGTGPDGLPYYTMPFIDGASLRERLAAGPLPVAEALTVLRDVARALAYAHAQGVVHRDIKPENVLLSSGAAVVTDFGVAKALSAAGGTTLTQAGMAVGTPAYMAPEQAAGADDVDHRADLYAWGLLAWEMLAGRHPFADRTSALALIGAHLTQVPAPLAQVRPDASPALGAVVARCLAKDPADRPADAGEVLRALDTVAHAPASTRAATASPGPGTRVPRTDSETSAASVAVLPFANMSASTDDAYFADGMTEEIINVLAQVGGLYVAARTSCFAFKGKDEDLRFVGDKLGVRYVLEGSVRKAGQRMRITAQLIDAADGYHLWSEHYDRELVDVFAVQDEIAGAIATKLRLSLLPRQEGGSRAAPRNLEAYELLLKGRVLLGQRGRAILDALPCFERAAQLDPGLADAHALLGDAYRLKWIYGMAPAAETVPHAFAAVERALALEPAHAQALSAFANLKSTFDMDVEGAFAVADAVLARTPLQVQALCERGLVAALRTDSSPQRLAQALHHLRTARQADPLNAWATALESIALACVGLYEEGAREARHAVALDAHAFTGRWALVWNLSALGRDAEALGVAAETLPMSGRSPRMLAEIAAIHGRRGEVEAAREILDELHGRAGSGYVEWSVLGAVTAAVGSAEQAGTLVARGLEEHEVYWQFAKSPAWAPFRADLTRDAMLRTLGY